MSRNHQIKAFASVSEIDAQMSTVAISVTPWQHSTYCLHQPKHNDKCNSKNLRTLIRNGFRSKRGEGGGDHKDDLIFFSTLLLRFRPVVMLTISYLHFLQ